MPSLFDKVYGAEAAGTIANSMGDVTEGLRYREIEERYGFVQELLPQDKQYREHPSDWGEVMVYHAHHRPPGMTEDGMERHRLLVTAAIEKGGRITIEDLARTWKRDIDPSKFGYLLGPQDKVIYESLKAGIPPWEVGRYASWPRLIGTSKMMIPVGLINAGNPAQAALDALDLARIKDVRGVPGNYAHEVAAGLAAAAAEAMKSDASVDSIIQVALGQLTSVPRAEVEMGLEWAHQVSDWRDLRPLYDEKYEGHRISNAVEMLSAGLATFYITDGDPEQAIIANVNLGRDTDCKAYIAGGLSGALRGIDAVPQRWVDVVTEQVKTDPYTVSRRTPRESAEGLYRAILNNIDSMKAQIDQLERQIVEQTVAAD
ncbi:MAG TPA: ADP-ribosylglycohydrolase family protein [Thermomicrobiales bacterium]|nr:ADP-ribosylglycohydrolase family protein [Thermomicrobiales bacterium]